MCVCVCVTGADPYAIVKVEGEEVRVPVVKDTLNPEWNWRMTFYRKKPGSEVRIEVGRRTWHALLLTTR